MILFFFFFRAVEWVLGGGIKPEIELKELKAISDM